MTTKPNEMEDQYRYAEMSGYNFVHRSVSYGNDSSNGRQQSVTVSKSGSTCIRWMKRKLTMLTFVLLIASVILFSVSTKWKADKLTVNTLVHHKQKQPTLRNQPNPRKLDWQITNPFFSIYGVTTPPDDIMVGSDITVWIQALNSRNEPVKTGGDFWLATIVWTSTPRASCAGKVVDHDNGNYSVNFHAVRNGLGQINLILVHPKKAVDFLREQWDIGERIFWIGTFAFNNEIRRSRCFITRHVVSTDEFCLYGNPTALGGTAFVCRKLTDIPCEALSTTLVDHKKTSNRTLQLAGKYLYLFEKAYYWNKLTKGPQMIYINNGNSLVVSNSKTNMEFKPKKAWNKLPVPPRPAVRLPPCVSQDLHDNARSSSDGYWLGERWTSLTCAVKQWDASDDIVSCLRRKHLYILGGSTLRQWVACLYSMMGLQTVLQPHEKFYTDRYIRAYDINMTFRFHPQVVSGYSVNVNDVEYETDILDNLTNASCNYVIAIGPWSHFNQWTRESYIERLLLLRQAVERFRQKCPHVPIIVKGSHPREHDTIESVLYSSDYILREMGVLMRDIFADSGVWFLDVWEMNIAYPVPNIIHMPWEVVQQEINMFLSYVCHYTPSVGSNRLGGKLNLRKLNNN